VIPIADQHRQDGAPPSVPRLVFGVVELWLADDAELPVIGARVAFGENVGAVESVDRRGDGWRALVCLESD
jgi:hypothetical protein